MEKRTLIMKKKSIAIGLNALLVIMGIAGFVLTVRDIGFFDFQYYTQDSNLLSLIASCFLLYYLVKGKKVPRNVTLLKYMSVVSLSVTFLVVIFILAPMFSFNYKWLLLAGNMLFYHFLCPVVAFISFVFFEEHSLEKKDFLVGILFTIIYAIILVVLNALGVVDGPYPFLKISEQSLLASIFWMICILGGACLIALGLRYLKKSRG